MSDMRFLVVGLGSIGRRHIHNLKRIYPTAKISVWRRKQTTEDLGDVAPLVDQVVTSIDDALASQPDAALVTNPASLHVETSLALAQNGVHLFVEKPISNTIDGVDTLLELCRERDLVLMVGYNFRFYKPLQAMRQALTEGRIGRVLSLRTEVGQYLPDWRPGSDYRGTVSAQRELGGGVVLELSHELDYVRWLVGEVETVSAQIGHLSDLEIDVEDTAEITLRFANGAIGNVHMNMIQRSATRTCRIIGTEGMLAWDFMSNNVGILVNGTSSWSDLHPREHIDRNDMYVAELRHFLECVKGDETPIVSGDDGRRVLDIALATRRSSEEGRVVELPGGYDYKHQANHKVGRSIAF